MDSPLPQVFSPGWLLVVLVILGYCLFRIVIKARVIHEKNGMGAGPVRILGAAEASAQTQPREVLDAGIVSARELSSQGKVDEALAACEAVLSHPAIGGMREVHAQAARQKGLCLRMKAAAGDRGALLKAGESFRKALALAAPSMLHELHARIQADLGETYLAQAQGPERRERLIAAARAFFSGAEAAGDSRASLKADLLFKLGGAYEELAGEAGEERALRRAAAACGEGIRCVSGPSEVRARVLLLLRLANVSAKLGRKGHREDMERAAKAYRLALKELPQDGGAYAKTAAALAEAEKALGGA